MDSKCPRCLTVYPSDLEMFRHIENGCKRPLAATTDTIQSGKLFLYFSRFYHNRRLFLVNAQPHQIAGPSTSKIMRVAAPQQHLPAVTGNIELLIFQHSFLILIFITDRMIFCKPCRLHVASKGYAGHLRSARHKAHNWQSLNKGVEVCRTAFGGRLVSYKVVGERTHLSVPDFMAEVSGSVRDLIRDEIYKHGQVKVNFELYGLYYLVSRDIKEIKSFFTNNEIACASSSLSDIYSDFTNVLETKASEFLERDSGWILERFIHLEVNINKFNPLRASSYIPLPPSISKKKAVINIKNDDEFCFAYSVLAAVYTPTTHSDRVTSYPDFHQYFDFTGLDFPVPLKQISKFESQNNLSINVYGLENIFTNGKMHCQIVGPLHYSLNKRDLHINLLLIDDSEGNTHYCYIKNLSRLVSSQLSNHKHSVFFCDGCLQYFKSETKLAEHCENDCNHVSVILPKEVYKVDRIGRQVLDNVLQFADYQKQLRIPFVVYADFECLLKEIVNVETPTEDTFTVKKFEHVPCSFGYYIKCAYDDSLSKLHTYTGLDAPQKFVSKLEEDLTQIYFKHLKPIIPMEPLSPKQNEDYLNATVCHICEEAFGFTDVKVKDHDHLTGLFRGAAHSTCNLNFKVGNLIPIFFHNLKNYDAHLFIRHLALNGERIDIIPSNFERYISFTKFLPVEVVTDSRGCQRTIHLQLRFLDSFQFLTCSLDTLASNLDSQQCRTIRKFFPSDIHFNLMRKKGIMPYCYMNDFTRLQETSLPCRGKFFDHLRQERVSTEDYRRAQEVWNVFNCHTLGEYYELYLKCDVLLLADVFETYRDLCLETYKLDPAQYFTAPGLSWDAMLKFTKVKLDLLTDVDMLHFFKKGIRGGFSAAVRREARANNTFCPNYDPKKPTSFIMYLDMCNMYGASMKMSLPRGDFRWLSDRELETISDQIQDLSENSPTGYVFEVDLEYPESLHREHNDFPFCPENMIPPGGKYPKLIQNLFAKQKYIIHYLTLKQCLAYGLKLKRIHRGIQFTQSAWLAPYIELNTKLRNAAKNSFERDMFKLKTNSIYGKTMENVENRVDIKLATEFAMNRQKRGAENYISKPNFKSAKIFDENLVAIQMTKLRVNYNKPIYVGFSILDISKTLIYDFFYGFLKKTYGDKASLCYSDTDSILALIETQNFYHDMKLNIDRFDTSNFPENNIHEIPRNPSIIGKMKDEFAGNIVELFLGTGSKAYYVKAGGDEVKKAKGINKCAIKNQLSLSDYQSVVNEKGKVYCTMHVFRSDHHNMFTNYIRKVALSHFDDKRYLIPNSKRTLAWGHKQIRSITETESSSIPSEDPLDGFIRLMEEVLRETSGSCKRSLKF